MVKLGDDWKDVLAYLVFRKQHLLLERQKIPFVIKEQYRNQVYKTLTAKVKEIDKTATVIRGDIKNASKYEYSKVQHLNKMKIDHLCNLKNSD
jgi:hypothetical protein